MEHLAFHAGQRKDRKIDDHDDQLSEQQRTARLAGRRKHLMETLPQRQFAPMVFLRMRQAAHAVLDDDHGAIDDDAEVQRAKTHEVCTDLVRDHAGKGEQHGQWNDHRSNQRRAEVAKEKEQDDDDQHGAFEQVLLHRGDRLVDEYGPVIHRDRMDTCRQRAIDLYHFVRDCLRDNPAVFADQHEHRAQHDLAPILGRSTGAQFRAQAYFGDVAHADRHTANVVQYRVADVVEGTHLAGGANQELLAAALDVTRADIAIVLLDGRDDVLERQAVGTQLRRIRRDVILLGEAADGVDLGDARDLAQLRLDDPVLDFAQVGWRVRCPVRLLRARFAFDRPQIDLTQAGRYRPHHRRDTGRQVFPGLLDALVDQLASKIDVRAILENYGHLGQAITRERSGLLQPRQAGHHGFDREGDALLDLERRVTGRRRVDLDLDVGDIRDCIDGQLLVTVDPDCSHAEHGQHDKPAVLDGEANNAIKHGAASCQSSCSALPLPCSAFNTKLPVVAYKAPGSSPETISTNLPSLAPRLTFFS